MIMTLVTSLTLALVSPSKLGPHVLRDTYDTGVTTILGACPRIAKWVTNDGTLNVPGQIAAYRSSCTGGKVVLRVYVLPSVRYTAMGAQATAEAAAINFWNEMQPGLAGIAPSQVDWLEGPNELDNFNPPYWYADYGASVWFAQFWSKLGDLMNAANYHPLVGSISFGNPNVANGGTPNLFKPIADAMKLKTYRWGWSYHAYSQNLSTDAAGVESWESLRYRRTRQESGLDGTTPVIPVVLTEGGQDHPGGWKSTSVATPPATYLTWLKWFDDRIKEDAYVDGVTLFQVGQHADWEDFSLNPIATQLADYIRPAGLDAGVLGTGTTPDGGTTGTTDAGSTGGGGTGTPPSNDPTATAVGSGSGSSPTGGSGGCASTGLAVLSPLLLLALAGLRRARKSAGL